MGCVATVHARALCGALHGVHVAHGVWFGVHMPPHAMAGWYRRAPALPVAGQPSCRQMAYHAFAGLSQG